MTSLSPTCPSPRAWPNLEVGCLGARQPLLIFRASQQRESLLHRGSGAKTDTVVLIPSALRVVPKVLSASGGSPFAAAKRSFSVNERIGYEYMEQYEPLLN